MKPVHAVAILAVPFALTCMLLLAAMCLTPYWSCKVDLSVPLAEAWKPILFVAVVLSIVAALVLTIDLLVVRLLPSNGYRFMLLAIAGGAIATLPRILWDLREGPVSEAFAPQVEFLPFTLAGAIFILVLARLVDGQHREKQSLPS